MQRKAVPGAAMEPARRWPLSAPARGQPLGNLPRARQQRPERPGPLT